MQFYKDKLAKLMLRLAQSLSMAEPEERHKDIRSKIKKTQEGLKQFRDLHHELYPETTIKDDKPVQTVQAKSSYSRLTYKDLLVFQLVGSTIWRRNKEVFDSPHHFIRTFERVLRAAECDIDREWEKWLSLAIHHDHDAWFDCNLADRDLKWKKAKKNFLEYFESTDRRIAKATEAYTMQMGPNESILNYGTRF